MAIQPTLLNRCAEAATAAEARFRIDAPEPRARATRVFTLDDGAVEVARDVATRRWSGAHFRTFHAPAPVARDAEDPPDARLGTPDGTEVWLSDELDGADVALIIATSDHGAEAASVIGRNAFARGIMTAGVVLPGDGEVERTVSTMRPYAMVLVVSGDPSDVGDLLTALRA